MRNVWLVVGLTLLFGCAEGGPASQGLARGEGSLGDGGVSGDGGDRCGEHEGALCCEGWCEHGLVCVAGSCTDTACGGLEQPCCSEGSPCEAGLTCLVGGCEPLDPPGGGEEPDPSDPDPSDPPSPSCGGHHEVCCDAVEPCHPSFVCEGGRCEEPAGCGGPGQLCCVGSTCDLGLSCEAGTCALASCGAIGASCGSHADCCDDNCDGGTCREWAPPPPADPCASATTCLDCTSRAECGFCDGRCVVSDFWGPLDGSFCDRYAWFQFEC